jgi:hypothetical protein
MLTQMFVTYGPKGWSSSKSPLERAEQTRNIFRINLKLFVAVEELLASKFWVQAKELQAGDFIEIRMPNPAGGRAYSFVLEVVTRVGPTTVVAPWPYNPPGLAEAVQQARAEGKPAPLPQIEHSVA